MSLNSNDGTNWPKASVDSLKIATSFHAAEKEVILKNTNKGTMRLSRASELGVSIKWSFKRAIVLVKPVTLITPVYAANKEAILKNGNKGTMRLSMPAGIRRFDKRSFKSACKLPTKKSPMKEPYMNSLQEAFEPLNTSAPKRTPPHPWLGIIH